MKKGFGILLFGIGGLLLPRFLFSQTNLVLNGSFEDTGPLFVCQVEIINNFYQGQAIIGWGTSTTGAEGFLACPTPGGAGDVPNNFAGVQYPKDGQQYAGSAFCYNNGKPYPPLNETLQGTLTEPLKAHQGYCIEFYASLAEGLYFNCYVDSFHIWFHKADTFYTSYNYASYNSFELYGKQQVSISTNNSTDTINWQQMIGGFTAEGGERKFILGNFKDKSQTKYRTTPFGNQQLWDNGTPDSTAFYYFDDFKVYECDQYGVGDHKIRLPNVFTPNGDGINDTYTIYENLPDGFLLRIYNRWGECIYTDDNYKNTWAPQNISAGVYWVVAQNPSSGTWFKQAVTVFTGE
ncbi:MAG: gliding motility-associated C-terminal domain-containing protein [Flavobacteriales bacterium]